MTVTVLAALGEHGQGWEVWLLPSLLPSSGILGLPQSTLNAQAWRRASSSPQPAFEMHPVCDATLPGDGVTPTGTS